MGRQRGRKSRGEGKHRRPVPAPAAEQTNRRTLWLTAAVLVLAVIAFYSPSLENGFINWDDDHYVTGNPHIADGLSWRLLIWSVTGFYQSNWHPLTWLSHALDVELHGVRRAGPHHLTSVLIHAAATLLLLLALRRLTGSIWRSATVAGLFALHPLHVESVAWISERKDVLCGLFVFLAIRLYADYAARPTARRYAGVVIAFAAALMSKPMAVTLPAVLLLLDAWPLGRLGRRSVLEKLPLLAMSAGAAVMTVAAQRAGGAIRALAQVPLTERFSNAAYALIAYLVKMAWPWPGTLLPFYPLPGRGGPRITAWMAIGCGLLIIAVSVIVILQRRRRPYLLVGWLFYLVTLLPVIGLVQVGNQLLADRYTYVPLIGPFVALVWLAADLAARFRAGRRTVLAAAVILLLVLGLLTARQQRIWGDPFAFWTSVAETFPRDSVSRTKLAGLYQDRGDERRAAELLREAVEAQPDDHVAAANLGHVLWRSGRPGDAVIYYQRSLAVDPDQDTAHNGLGVALLELGRADEAAEHFRRAAALNPDSPGPRSNLGRALMAVGDVSGAVRQYRSVIATFPDWPEIYVVHDNLGLALLKQRRVGEAVEEFKQVLRARPDYAVAYENMGMALILLSRFEDAARYLQRALELSPGLHTARVSLGLALDRQGKLDAAINEYRTVLSQAPGFLPARQELGRTLLRKGDLDGAETELRAVIEADPSRLQVYESLAEALEKQGRMDDASEVRAAAALVRKQMNGGSGK